MGGQKWWFGFNLSATFVRSHWCTFGSSRTARPVGGQILGTGRPQAHELRERGVGLRRCPNMVPNAKTYTETFGREPGFLYCVLMFGIFINCFSCVNNSCPDRRPTIKVEHLSRTSSNFQGGFESEPFFREGLSYQPRGGERSRLRWSKKVVANPLFLASTNTPTPAASEAPKLCAVLDCVENDAPWYLELKTWRGWLVQKNITLEKLTRDYAQATSPCCWYRGAVRRGGATQRNFGQARKKGKMKVKKRSAVRPQYSDELQYQIFCSVGHYPFSVYYFYMLQYFKYNHLSSGTYISL